MLATTCPHCSTRFRVVSDQLKLRSGLVRCGSCESVFNALEHLTYLEDQAVDPLDSLADQTQPPSTPANEPISISPPPDYFGEIQIPANPVDSDPPASATSSNDASFTLDRPPLTGNEPVISAGEIERHETAEQPETENGPLKETSAELTERSPAPANPVIAATRRHRQIKTIPQSTHKAKPSNPLGWLIGITVIVPLILVQLVFLFRNDLAAHSPSSMQLMDALCRPFGCVVKAPRKIEVLTIESFELQQTPTGSGRYRMNALIRNREAGPVATPAIELTMTNALGQPVIRKVFLREDLPLGPSIERLSPLSETPITLSFELDSTIAPDAIGYSISLFYP